MQKDKIRQSIAHVNLSVNKGYRQGDKFSINNLYYRSLGRANPYRNRLRSPEPVHYIGSAIGIVAGITGVLRNTATRKYLSQEKLNAIESQFKEIQSNLNSTGDTHVKELIANIINQYKRKKGHACSKSSQNLFNELQRNDLIINQKLDKIIHYVKPRCSIENYAYNKNNGKQLLNIIADELTLYQKQRKQEALVSITGIDQALKKNTGAFIEEGIIKDIRAFMTPPKP